jgi:RNA polymerase sigma-70 factor (ECF subfamily)
VAHYTAMLQQHDVEGMLALLTEDATWSMPPMPTWFRGHDAIAAFLAQAPFRIHWRHRPARANGQLAVGCFAWDDAAGAFLAYALDVLDLRGDRIASVISFVDGARFPAFGLPPAILE